MTAYVFKGTIVPGDRFGHLDKISGIKQLVIT
jgi:hypothetical protein